VSAFPSNPCRLVVVRHGATSWSRAGRHTGRTDLPLDPGGEAQARALASRLRPDWFTGVLVSPLRRARETCDLAGFGAGAEVVEDLAEWDYGDYEGLTSAQIHEQRPSWSLWEDGAPGGESVADVQVRADRVVDLARRSPGNVLAFAHGHILRMVAARWLDLPAAAGSRLLLSPAAVGVLGWEREVAVLGPWDDDGTPLG